MNALGFLNNMIPKKSHQFPYDMHPEEFPRDSIWFLPRARASHLSDLYCIAALKVGPNPYRVSLDVPSEKKTCSAFLSNIVFFVRRGLQLLPLNLLWRGGASKQVNLRHIKSSWQHGFPSCSLQAALQCYDFTTNSFCNKQGAEGKP